MIYITSHSYIGDSIVPNIWHNCNRYFPSYTKFVRIAK